jgi:hypothetical protein
MRTVPRPRYLLMTRKMTWWGVVLTAWDLWRRIPKQHRRRIYGEVRQHAPRVARSVAREVRRARAATRSAR